MFSVFRATNNFSLAYSEIDTPENRPVVTGKCLGKEMTLGLVPNNNVSPTSENTKPHTIIVTLESGRNMVLLVNLTNLLKCCFTSTETVGVLGTGAQDVHLDFHTAPEL